MAVINNRTPLSDEFMMPAEYDLHAGTIMIWPIREGSWGKDSSAAKKAFCNIFYEIIKCEDLYLIVDSVHQKEAKDFILAEFKNYLLKENKDFESIKTDSESGLEYVSNEPYEYKLYFLNLETDDSWARDTGPTFVRNNEGAVRGINWSFNAWGGEFDGLYASWDKDDKVASFFCDIKGYDYYEAASFVLEGGSIHSDGEGTVMVTESCLLSKGRNPELTKEEIEDKLKSYLGAEKVLWLPSGIYNDETNEHVDNVCAFVSPGEVVLAWTDNTDDPQYEMSRRDLEYLENVTDARGRHIRIHKLLVPKIPVCCTEEDIDNYVFEEGEDERDIGERLAASYVNFYFTNTSVLLPQFGGENTESDELAVSFMSKVCPGRKIVPIDARAILLGGGNIHCITQQIPDSISNMKRKVISFE
ncbi:MAG: agmatine deiminase [Butyrivibrio sp.]|nr:agmatine deiminase [Butyrivibrio sp.]